MTQRLQREGRWKDIEPERDEMMRLSKSRFKTKDERQQWVYSELDRMYPPLTAECATRAHMDSDQEITTYDDFSTQNKDLRQKPPLSRSQTYSCSDGQIQGLSSIPDGWPELPSNASLSTEIGWVQANRLSVVEERSRGATVVHLDRARSPAPSWAALGWLETSIRSYAKFVDVAAKATASEDDEASVWRHERRSREEVERIIGEMREAGDDVCRHCGQPR